MPRTRANGQTLATVDDIARAAGVSVATVSRVLNSSPKVASPTRRRVLHVLEDLGYAPNNLARNLRARALPVFGLVIPDIRNPVYTSLLRGVEDVARAGGYFVLLANTDEQPERQAEYLRMLLAERVAGVILVPAAGTRLDSVQALQRVGIPVLALDRPLPELDIDTVQPDRGRGVRLAVEHLVAHGHRAIALLNGPTELATARQRADAFDAALRSLGLERRAAWEAAADFRQEGGYQAARAVLAQRHRPTAMLVANNLMALGSMRAAAELGVRVPDELAIIAFDDTEWAPYLAPPLTTIAHDTQELGRMAAELLERRLVNPGRSALTVLLPPRLVVRESCGSNHARG
ncbi:MAG: LacI family transcriptional regulator [Chloroflexota bacterium]|nr:LacI family transcriptional regulator [Chloroflexota bacterium]